MASATKSDSAEIVVVGSCNTDFFFYTDKIPKTGETVTGSKMMTSYGGKGANQCIAAARLGGKVAFVARVGDDDNGREYLEHLEKENVDVKNVMKLPDIETGTAQITVPRTGQSVILINAGANACLTLDDVREVKHLIENAKVLVLQLEVPIEASLEAMRFCKAISIMNAAPAQTEYDPDLLKLPTIFCVNEVEAETFSGIPVATVENAVQASEKLLSMGCQSVLITLGEVGCIYADGKVPPRHFPTPKVTAVDCTGAGDAFTGSLAFMLSQPKQYSMEKCIEVASAVAADCVTKPGAHCTYADESFLKKFNL